MRAGLIGEFVDIEEWCVGQRVGLEIAPKVLDRIELRGVRRQELGSDIGLRSEERLHDASTVSLQPIPDQDPGRVQLPIELAEKVADGDGIEIGMPVKSEVQLHPIARRRHAQRGNGRDLLVRARTLLEDGCDAARMPGPPHQRRHQQAGLVDEDQPGSQARGVFFTRGQSLLTHCLIAVSSRSTARRVGFWGLHPMPCSSRPT